LTRASCIRAGAIAAGLVLALAAPARAQKDPHHDADSLNARLDELAKANPKTTRLVTVATTAEGEVRALEVDPTGTFSAKTPALLLQGGVHGSEWISTETVLRLAELAVDPTETGLGGLVYRFVPAVNLQGFEHGTRTAKDDDGTRYDLNREFPVPGEPDEGSPPVVQGMRDYATKGNVVGVLDYHSDAESILYPYAYARGVDPPDVDELKAITTEMARAVGYGRGQVSKVIGYKHEGTASDWYQHALGAPAILIELAGVDAPGSQTAEQILIDQERPFRLFVAWLREREGVAKEDADADPDLCVPTTITRGAGSLGYVATGELCGGRRHGPWSFAFATGEPMREGTYERGLEVGAWKTFHRSGAKQDEGQFTDGRPDGSWVRYAKGGRKIMERAYDDGDRDGSLKRWTDDGTLVLVRSCSGSGCSTRCKATEKKVCMVTASGDVTLVKGKGPVKKGGKEGESAGGSSKGKWKDKQKGKATETGKPKATEKATEKAKGSGKSGTGTSGKATRQTSG
jgi:predicted deacylase